MEKINIDEELKYIDKVNEINKGKILKYYILTMGCQLNENDSEKLSGMLEKMNYKKTLNMEEADLVLFNTCCVRENAEEKLFGKVGEVKKQKENNNSGNGICDDCHRWIGSLVTKPISRGIVKIWFKRRRSTYNTNKIKALGIL